MQPIHEEKHVGALAGARADENGSPEDPAFWASKRPRHRPAQSLDLDPRAAPRLRGLDGVVGGRRQAAGGRLQASRPTSCSGSRRCPACRARRCGSSTPSCRRSSAAGYGPPISTWSLLIPAVGIGLAVQDTDTPYSIFLVAGAAVRLRRRQLRLLDGQHQLLLPEGGEGQRARAQRRPRQSRRQRGAVPGAAGRSPPASSARSAASRRLRPAAPSCGCRMPASSGCRSSPLGRSPPGSA